MLLMERLGGYLVALNKKILQKLDQKSYSDKKIKDFLFEVIEYESKNLGWYEKEYLKILQKHCQEEDNEI